ncbi:putative hydrolase domain protein [Mycobacterium avium subsp. avium 2285 (R)]|nr:putative hydrolase domain protein [Mycobacterium avium subsp. avium 2285 (R)]
MSTGCPPTASAARNVALVVLSEFAVTGGSPHALREEELVADRAKLSGKRIIIDPGRGGADHGMIMQGPSGPISEADVCGTWQAGSRAG